MTAEKFIKDAEYLFTGNYLSTIPHESPWKVASQKLNRKFKAYLKSVFPEATLYEFNSGFCESSGFVEIDNKYVYVSISDLRYWDNWSENVLIRTAKHYKDYTGGRNHYTTIKNIRKDIIDLMNRES